MLPLSLRSPARGEGFQIPLPRREGGRGRVITHGNHMRDNRKLAHMPLIPAQVVWGLSATDLVVLIFYTSLIRSTGLIVTPLLESAMALLISLKS
jgi:hypothetical protein